MFINEQMLTLILRNELPYCDLKKVYLHTFQYISEDKIETLY